MTAQNCRARCTDAAPARTPGRTMKRLLLHVGFPKAASTSLQNGLLLQLHKAGAINFLGRAFESGYYGVRKNKGDYKGWFDLVVGSRGYDPNNALGELSDSKVNVLSEGLFMMNERHGDTITGPVLLHKYFDGQADEIKILIVLRRQPDLLPSYFTQNFRKLGKKDFTDFISHHASRGWSGEAKIFNYYDVAQAYAAQFGKDNVHIVFFEDFARNKERFSADLAKVLRLEPQAIARHMGEEHLNQSRKESGTIVIRKLDVRSARHRLIRFLEGLGLKSWADRFRLRIPAISDQNKQTVFAAFKDSNLRLAQEFGLDQNVMREYGYF
jgi:hypothetical protein